MSGTHFFYNGILLRDCTTDDFVQDIEYDESGTDALYSRFRITVTGLVTSLSSELTDINPASTQGHDSAAKVPTPGQGNDREGSLDDKLVVDRLRIIEARLQEPRKDFWLAINGAAIESNYTLDAPKNYTAFAEDYPYRIVLASTGIHPNESSTTDWIKGFNASNTNALRKDHQDFNDGPKPRSVSAKIIGGRCIRVTVTIETCVCICRGLDSGTTPPARDVRKVKGVISNRWSVTESLDRSFATTHSIDGVLVVSDHRFKAQSMRTMVHPTLFPYARLESRDFSVDKSGLKLGYRFAIKEQGEAPPPGLIDWDATYSETSGVGYAKGTGSFNCKVTGSIKRPLGMTAQQQKKIMLRLMYALLKSRIAEISSEHNPIPGTKATICIFKEGVITERLGKPEMEMRALVEYSDDNLDAYNFRLERMGTPISETIPGHDARWWPMPDLWQWDTESENNIPDDEFGGGSYLEPYHQYPCDLWHSIPRAAKTDQIGFANAEPNDPQNPIPPNPNPPNPNGVFSRPFVAYNVTDILGNLGSVDTMPSVTPDRFGIDAAQQLSGFSYVQWDSDVTYNTNMGKLHLPLSRARQHPLAVSTSVPNEKQTAVVIQIHEPTAQRIFTMIVSRRGKWPEIPMPAPIVKDTDGYYEELLSFKFVPDTPKLETDNTNVLYSIQVEMIYALSRPPAYSILSAPAGTALTSTDKFRSGSSRIDKSTPVTNRIACMDIFNSGSIDA